MAGGGIFYSDVGVFVVVTFLSVVFPLFCVLAML